MKSRFAFGLHQLLRTKQPRRNFITQAFKVEDNLIEPEAKMAGHVFEKYKCRFDFAKDSMDMRPKVPRIVLSTMLDQRD